MIDFLVKCLVCVIYGVGLVFVKKFECDGLYIFNDICQCGDKVMVQCYGDMGYYFLCLLCGEDMCKVNLVGECKSVFLEIMFWVDINDFQEFEKCFYQLCVKVVDIMKFKQIFGMVIIFKFKSFIFKIKICWCILIELSQLVDILFKVGWELLVGEMDGMCY